GTRPAADIEIGHQATTLSLLGMLSLKLGRSVEWDASRERIIDDDEANALLVRPYRAPWIYPSISS
ncbi:MAG: gfo/Idh/MocA family oxidoreductase, partial [Planctomycetales bacterium]|nr:gfo/Idh/MocA family oxidoreductase [Planctomycetales bacterium]